VKVEVRLHAVLRDLLEDGRATREVAEGTTVAGLLDELGVDEDLRELVTVNREQIDDLSHELQDGDAVEVFPAVAGGARSPYLDEAARLYAEGDYFMTHEVLEEHWLEVSEDERDFFQGLIHLAVGLHHYERGNLNGTRAQFTKARRRLDGYSERHHGVDVARIREFLEGAPGAIERDEDLTPPPL
jgi:molybdopterin converting factor small subunit